MPDEADPDVQIVRDDDPRRAELEAAGYRVVGESWGARLRLSEPPDLSTMRTAMARAEAHGIVLRELGVDYSDALCSLESQNHADYPYTPATAPALRDADATRTLWTNGNRIFGTGGAGVNEASLGANRALGHVIEEHWRSYERISN